MCFPSPRVNNATSITIIPRTSPVQSGIGAVFGVPPDHGQSRKSCCKMHTSHYEEIAMDSWNHACQACGSPSNPLTKLSLGKDFFGRPYDRLSPSSDQNPRWYCTSCSLHKHFQRDFRDILAEFNKLRSGFASELSKADEFRRASLRLHEIMTILNAPQQTSILLNNRDVTVLMERLNTLTMPV